MGKVSSKKRNIHRLLLGVVMTIISASVVYSLAQYHKSTLKIPAPAQTVAPKEANDSKNAKNNRYSTATPTTSPSTTYNETNFPIKQAAPQSYEELLTPPETPIDLKQPKNIESHIEYDINTKSYVVRTMVGDREIMTPFILSDKQFNDWQTRMAMHEYYRQRNAEALEQQEKQPFNIFDMNFALGPLEKIFGPGGVQL